jgi:hypothetical protein
MSIISTLNRRNDATFAETNAPIVCGDHLTDGSRLLYTAGVIGGADGLVWLEDCQSLELLLATASVHRLRPVPADRSSGGKRY